MTLVSILPLSDQDVARFWSYVQKGDGCWSWTGASMRKDGRGRFGLRGRNYTAPRVAWAIANDAEPTKFVCHSCDNPSCVKPDHLWLGAQADNMRDASQKGRMGNQRKTHCPLGHPYSPENTITRSKRGWSERSCRECAKASGRQRMRRIREAHVANGLTTKGRARA